MYEDADMTNMYLKMFKQACSKHKVNIFNFMNYYHISLMDIQRVIYAVNNFAELQEHYNCYLTRDAKHQGSDLKSLEVVNDDHQGGDFKSPKSKLKDKNKNTLKTSASVSGFSNPVIQHAKHTVK